MLHLFVLLTYILLICNLCPKLYQSLCLKSIFSSPGQSPGRVIVLCWRRLLQNVKVFTLKFFM